MTELARQLEALLFVADQPLSLEDCLEYLATASPTQAEVAPAETEVPVNEFFPPTIADLQSALVELQDRHNATTALELRPIDGGWQLFSRPEFAPYTRKLILDREQKRLSKTALETLSIIAYKQPVSKSELDFIRGVDSHYAVQKLLEKQLIEPAGRADTPGKPLLYRTSSHFMRYFGLNSLEDLPKPKELLPENEANEADFQTKRVNEEDPTPGPVNTPHVVESLG
jgi:segregation and condensation protein B